MEYHNVLFIIRWRLHTAGMLQLELTNGPFKIQGKININTSRLLFSQKVHPLKHITNWHFRVTFALNMHCVT
jgi:hypothetical protein